MLPYRNVHYQPSIFQLLLRGFQSTNNVLYYYLDCSFHFDGFTIYQLVIGVRFYYFTVYSENLSFFDWMRFSVPIFSFSKHNPTY